MNNIKDTNNNSIRQLVNNFLEKLIVTLGISRMTVNANSMLNWQLIPMKGIESNSLKIYIGMSREEIKTILTQKSFTLYKNSFENEDDYKSNEGEFLRFRFEEKILVDIELLNANLFYQDIPLHNGTTFDEIESALSDNVSIRETEWLGDGHDFLELAVNIATYEEAGGDGDEIEWVILSKAFK